MRAVVFVLLVACAGRVTAEETQQQLAGRLAQLDTSVFLKADPVNLSRRSVDAQLRAANEASSAAWSKITSREEWETFRRDKLAKLRKSLKLPSTRPPVKMHVAGELAGDGYTIQNIVFQTRPGWLVTANLYLPAKTVPGMPGILLSHSHHSPKSQGELQDMGATWSRAGCAVLVPDHLGHGERRQHPFASAKDYDKEFPVSRQDYNFRYDASLQLYLCGESLMGWMVHDLMGGVDVLLALPGIDAQKIILLGGVAGGGDPAAVTGAVDERITCVGPFNFGGPQPETRYPLPDDAEAWFHYAGSGSWESTRNLADSAADGFLPWVIAGSIAPRKLIYGHEFSWDRERDPVYRRLEKIWSLYDSSENLGFAHGRGTLRGNKPEDTHCGNIGAFHRKMIHPLLDRWFALGVKEADEFSSHRSAKELACWTPQLQAKLQPKALHELLRRQAAEQISSKSTDRPAAELRSEWAWRLGVWLNDETAYIPRKLETGAIDYPGAEAWESNTNDGGNIQVLLLPPAKVAGKMPLVVAVAQGGHRPFLKQRNEELATLLSAGVAVALVDLRHSGVNAEGDDRGPHSEATSHSASYLMLGHSLLGAQVQDLRLVLHTLRSREDIDNKRIALWGESFAKPLARDADFKYPRRVDRPAESDPLGAELALCTALVEEQLCAVAARGGLVDYASCLDSPFVQAPHPVILRDVFRAGDLPVRTSLLPARQVYRSTVVDGVNRVAGDDIERKSLTDWLLEALKVR